MVMKPTYAHKLEMELHWFADCYVLLGKLPTPTDQLENNSVAN